MSTDYKLSFHLREMAQRLCTTMVIILGQLIQKIVEGARMVHLERKRIIRTVEM